jgi:phosphatidylserine/phosphatidylglycerophosphate/cardiolipin synthase-like enzyme
MILLTLCCIGPLAAQSPFPDLEIVESVPVETQLNTPHIRNTPKVWSEMIEGAQKSLDIEQFYVSDQAGEALQPIIQAIVAATRRGVKLRFISEEKFYRMYPETLDMLGKQPNSEVRILNFSALKEDGVEHAKFFIVDREQVFIGSQNFDWRSLKHIREIGVRIRHTGFAEAVSDIFELDWQLSKAQNPKQLLQTLPKKEYPLPFTIMYEQGEKIEFSPVWAPKDISYNEDMWSLAAILKLLAEAQKEVVINLLTYSPANHKRYWPELDVALRSAATRGVIVRLIVADWCKTHPKIDHLKSLSLVPNITVKLCTIPQHSSGFIAYARVTHAKYMVVDEAQCWIGTSNWERNYYYNCRDMGVIVKNQKFCRTLYNIFGKDWESPYVYTIQPEKEYQPPQVGH